MKLLISLVLFVLLASFIEADDKMDEGTTDCICPVTANIDYVCGSNGVTYTNPSALRCAAECTKKQINLSHRGQCGGQDQLEVI